MKKSYPDPWTPTSEDPIEIEKPAKIKHKNSY